ncbi:MAG: cyclic nucleotide-binding domain-containing protein [Spirochaetia bacterium]|nr:cyclic nucleotide-binding domain-containing protein [Spirochaetia bacterium]
MSAPVSRKYKASSIIYFEGDRNVDEVFVLKQGQVTLISPSLDFKNETKETVKRGEFFGVKSALGRYPREETVQVVTDCEVLVFKTSAFEQFSLKNPSLVLQMLKVFSSQLRKVHRKVRETLGERDVTDTSVEVMRVAEYYYKQGNYKHAEYAYNAYIKNYPEGALIARAEKMLTNIKQGQAYPSGGPDLDAILYGEQDVSVSEDSGEISSDFESMPDDSSMTDDFTAAPIDNSGDFDLSTGEDLGDFTAPASNDMDFSAPASSDMDFAPSNDFSLDSDFGSSDLDMDFSSQPSSNGGGISSIYYDGLNDFSQENYDAAIEKFNKVINAKSFSNDEEASLPEKAIFEKGRALMKKNNMKEALASFSEYIKTYPEGESKKKSVMHIAEVFEKTGDKARAVAYYKKAATIKPIDKDTTRAKNKIEQLGG